MEEEDGREEGMWGGLGGGGVEENVDEEEGREKGIWGGL